MWCIVKLLSTAVFTVCILLLAANPALAQSGYSITESSSVYSGSGAAPDGGGGKGPNTQSSGNWSVGNPADTVYRIYVFYSQDQVNRLSITVPNTGITGQGGPSGTYSVEYYLPPGKYYIYAGMKTVLGQEVFSTTSTFTQP